ncbi:protein MCM10 homolog [Protopterus annectens]|uniref:protein MCM10 homolog n=1 Tax=Protopterus annectens TaxID=7888 RepID=UPI001CFAF4FD|nr:protein MCM10 homolog [Protopterus annectens]
MEVDDDLELLTSLLEENVAAGGRCFLDEADEEAMGNGASDDLDDLFDADADDEDEELFMQEDNDETEEKNAGQRKDGSLLFGDGEDLELEETTSKKTGVSRNVSESSSSSGIKSKEELAEELMQMQAQMKKLQEQLEMAVTAQLAAKSPIQKSPTSRKQDLAGKCKISSLKENTTKGHVESTSVSSSMRSPSQSQTKAKQQTVQDASSSASGKCKISSLKENTTKGHVESTSVSSSMRSLSQSQTMAKLQTVQDASSSASENRSPPQRVSPSNLTSQLQKSSSRPSTSATTDSSGMSSSKSPGQNVSVEKYSGLRLRRPRVSSLEMDRKMTGRKLIRLSQLPSRLSCEKLEDIDWVTFGVIIKKITPQSSNNGKTFSIWRLNDLRNLEICVSLFLFGDVHKEHWKTDQGTVIGLLNANSMKSKEGSDEICLSVDHPQKVLLMGEALDMGCCKARKKNGDPCTQIVNLNDCEYCQYHVKAQYKKLSSKRADLQSSFSGRAPARGRGRGTGLKEKLCREGFYYGGVSSASYAASLTAAVPKKPTQTKLGNLFVRGADAILKETKQKIAMARNDVTGCSDEFKDLMSMPTPGALNLKKHLNKPTSQVTVGKQSFQSLSASELLKMQKQQMLDVRKKRAEATEKRFLETTSTLASQPSLPAQQPSFSSPRHAAEFPKGQKTVPTPQTPRLGSGFSEGEDILFFDASPSPASKPSSSAGVNRLAAINKLHTKGVVITKEDPNSVKRKQVDLDVVKVMDRVEKTFSSPEVKEEIEPAMKKRKEQLAYLESEEFHRILSAKSKHTGALQEAEAELMEQYFEPLLKKEQLEEKMRSIRELKCRVVTCKTCRYTFFKPLETCVSENHEYHWHDAVKRFFKCPCGARAISLDRLPKKNCSNCGLYKWERDGMLKEKSGPKIGGELLLTRGEEQPKFLNSMK